MIHTEKVENAIRKAAQLHHGQTRKGDIDLPYVTHLFSVATIISNYTDDEDTIVAGLLHDTIEDTDYASDELQKDFGENVRAIVMGVTEPQPEGDEKIPWDDRKRGYIENLRKAPEASLIVAAADKIHNFESTIRSFAGNQESFQKLFSGTKDTRTQYYGTIVEVITERLGDHPITERLRNAFAEYKAFLQEMG